jgi:hypothetical protein
MRDLAVTARHLAEKVGDRPEPEQTEQGKSVSSSTSWGSSWTLVSSTVRMFARARPTLATPPKRRRWSTWAKEESEKSSKRI